MTEFIQEQEEQVVLACLLWRPQANRWELDGLEADLFTRPVHRAIADALIAQRDSGRFVHWTRVRKRLRRAGNAVAAEHVEPLVRAIGTTLGLTVAVSRLHYAREHRRRAA